MNLSFYLFIFFTCNGNNFIFNFVDEIREIETFQAPGKTLQLTMTSADFKQNRFKKIPFQSPFILDIQLETMDIKFVFKVFHLNHIKDCSYGFKSDSENDTEITGTLEEIKQKVSELGDIAMFNFNLNLSRESEIFHLDAECASVEQLTHMINSGCGENGLKIQSQDDLLI